MDEAARRAATEAGRAATEAEKARAEDIVAVGAADDGCVRSPCVRKCVRGEGAKERESISDAPCFRTGG